MNLYSYYLRLDRECSQYKSNHVGFTIAKSKESAEKKVKNYYANDFSNNSVILLEVREEKVIELLK